MKKISETLLEIMEEALPGFTKLVEERVAEGKVLFGHLPFGAQFHDFEANYTRVERSVRKRDDYTFNAISDDGELARFNSVALVTRGWLDL